jgi:hypothetical protein
MGQLAYFGLHSAKMTGLSGLYPGLLDFAKLKVLATQCLISHTAMSTWAQGEPALLDGASIVQLPAFLLHFLLPCPYLLTHSLTQVTSFSYPGRHWCLKHLV